ncbi:hypothetical protein LAZ67_9002369 [Cordylochernes scorpioides]|uniref:Retrotransposon gag domain-containing protein n=1 Tax=Cordylochernes scorpioides TaxID=51811 RepID=A0ABY6KTT9_9ARAC|nr:hypothetical protein LAZ67_9002369 [Cordylochernes scorpioides]
MEREENRPFCHRWRDPTVFSGERGEDSQRWLSDFQRVARYNKWDDSMCLANVIFYLTGTAKCWFENFEEILNSWEEFKIKFCEIFGNKEDTARKAENILRTRAQTSGENVESYIQEVLLLCKQSNPRMSEGEKVSHLIKGVAEEVYQALVGKDISTVDQFVAFCRRVEAFKRMRVAPPRFNRLPNVTTISTAEPENLEALIRRIVREEVQKFMAPPSTFAAQDIDTPSPDLRNVIRSEIQQTLAPISAPRQPESFRPRRQYLPQNDQERLNKTLTDMISMYVDVDQKNWDNILPYVTFAYNTARQETTGYSPFFLVHGREVETPLDSILPYQPAGTAEDYVGHLVTNAEDARMLARLNILQAQSKDKERYDKKHQEVTYKEATPLSFSIAASSPQLETTECFSKIKPPTYDGQTSWKCFKTQFEVVALGNRWNSSEKAINLAASLRGSATEVLQSLPLEQSLDYECLVHALTLRFEDDNFQPYHVVKLKNRRQERDETLRELAADVERLARLAFTDCPRHAQDLLAHQNFVDAIEDPEGQQSVRMSEAKTLQEALIHALKFEAARDATRGYQKVVRLMKADESQEDGKIKEAISQLQRTVQEMKKYVFLRISPGDLSPAHLQTQ